MRSAKTNWGGWLRSLEGRGSWVVWGLGAGLLGLFIPLLAHAVRNPEHFTQHDSLVPRVLVPHAILLVGGVTVGIGWWQSSRKAERMADRSRYIFWAGVFPFGVLFAAIGCLEKVVRRSGYQLSAVQGWDIAELLLLRVALWSIAGYVIGASQWNDRQATLRERAGAHPQLEGAVELRDGADERRPY